MEDEKFNWDLTITSELRNQKYTKIFPLNLLNMLKKSAYFDRCYQISVEISDV